MLLTLYASILTAALAAPDGLEAALAEHAAHSTHALPTLSAGDLRKLDGGELVRLRLPAREGVPVVVAGLVVLDLGRKDVWLGTMDPDVEPHGDLHIHHLPLLADEVYRWYGFLDLPTPFDDRHFVVQTTIDRAMAKESAGRIWERSWTLEPGWAEVVRPVVASGGVEGVGLERFEDAVALPVNHGTWTAMRLSDARCLLAYQVSLALGGEIPDGLVTRYLFWSLGAVLESVVDRARTMEAHYAAGHTPIAGGDGLPVPLYGAWAGDVRSAAR